MTDYWYWAIFAVVLLGVIIASLCVSAGRADRLNDELWERYQREQERRRQDEQDRATYMSGLSEYERNIAERRWIG